MIASNFENGTKQMYILQRQNAKFLNVKAGGIYYEEYDHC
jgi:hypothetical protein